MFFQYFRGRREELLALRRTVSHLSKSGKIMPIIEPVKAKSASLESAIRDLATAAVPVAVVTNPTVGELAGSNILLKTEFIALREKFPGMLQPAQLVLSSTKADQVEDFLSSYSNDPVTLVHVESPSGAAPIAAACSGHGSEVVHLFRTDRTSAAYRATFTQSAQNALHDGFLRRKNADYPADELFSDLIVTHKSLGYIGFGDYSIAGDHFKERGGAAHAVAIHLTYDAPSEGVRIKHFVSDSVLTSADPAGKFLEALTKLVKYLKTAPTIAATEAAQEFIQLHAEQHFPGLGALKQLSMRHHIELMVRLLG